jgi:hypothetical protein
MRPRSRERVEIDGRHDPLDVAGVMVVAGDLLDPRPMLQKYVHHVQRVALAIVTVDRGPILQRLAGDAIDDPVLPSVIWNTTPSKTGWRASL